MLKSRRGLLAAGLAVAVAGAIGVASTMNAGAEQIPGGRAADAAASATADPSASSSAAVSDPDALAPAVLPWGTRPARIRKGRAGMSSDALRAQGLSAADTTSDQSTLPRAGWGLKGRSARNSTLRTEQTNIAPPDPAASVSPSDSSGASTSASPSDSASASPSATAVTTTDAPSSAPATSTAPTSTPSSSSPASAGSGSDHTVNFLYDIGSQAAVTDGFFSNVTIGSPTLAQNDYHTLAEMALQSADGKQIVEIGWNVDRSVNGDDDPHLFVYHWVNGASSCYNACGFTQYSPNIKPGDTLTSDVTKKFGIQYFNGAWWVAYDTEWVGYFPSTLWSSQGANFTQSGFLQVFGEVAASSATPCTQMGNGLPSSNTAAARFSSVSYLNGPTTVLTTRNTASFYTVTPVSTRSFYYGGPGAC